MNNITGSGIIDRLITFLTKNSELMAVVLIGVE